MSTFIRLAVPGCDLASGEGADLLHLEVGIVEHRARAISAAERKSSTHERLH